MTPHLSAAGSWVLVAAAAFFVVATIGGRPALFVPADLLLLGVAAAWGRAVYRAREVDERRLTVEARIDDEALRRGVHRGDEFDVVLVVAHAGRGAVSGVRLRLADASGVSFEQEADVGTVRAGQSITTRVTARAARSGRWVVQGATLVTRTTPAWVEGAAWVPLELEVQILPSRHSVGRGATELRRRRRAMAPVGAHRARRAGFGYELRELRDYVAGDSTRHIAWRASARQGRLMVRQFEDELVVSSMLVFDASSSMRGGDGGSKLEHAIDIAAAWSTGMLARHDRVGIVSFDEAVIGRLAPDAGAVQARRLLRHLLALQHPVHAERTALSDDAVVERVARWLSAHRRLDFRQRTPRGPAQGDAVDDVWDVPLLERWIEARADDLKAWVDELAAAGIDLGAVSPTRRFAAARGIELAGRSELRFGDKEVGLAAALRDASMQSRDAMLLTVVTDLCGLMRLEPVLEALAVAHARRHQVAFIVPWTPDYVAAGASPAARLAHEAFAMAERDERASLARTLREKGAVVLFTGPDQPPDAVSRTLDVMLRAV